MLIIVTESTVYTTTNYFKLSDFVSPKISKYSFRVVTTYGTPKPYHTVSNSPNLIHACLGFSNIINHTKRLYQMYEIFCFLSNYKHRNI